MKSHEDITAMGIKVAKFGQRRRRSLHQLGYFFGVVNALLWVLGSCDEKKLFEALKVDK